MTTDTSLRRAAWCSLVLHGLAGMTMLLVLERGLQTNTDLEDRLRWLDGSRTLWRLAWLPWPLAAASMLFLGAAFARAVPGEMFGRAVTALFGVAVALDLVAESLLMGVLPDAAAVAAADPAHIDGFLLLERSAVMITGFAANGFYTVGACLMAWRMRGVLPAWANAAGVAVGGAGGALSVAALLGSADGMYWTNFVLVPAVVGFQLGIIRARPLSPAVG